MTQTMMVDPELKTVAFGMIAAEDEAWRRGDAEAFAAHALYDIVFTNVVGSFSVGRAAFVAQHERIFTGIYKGTTLRQTVENIAILNPDAMLVSTYARLEGAEQPPPGVVMIEGVIHTRPGQILVRRDGGWGLASFTNVAIRPGQAAIPEL